MQHVGPFVSVSLVALLAQPAGAQCQQWSQAFAVPGIDGVVYDQIVWDDGQGPALFVAGEFQAAGTVAASNIARWDGTSWSALGAGISAPPPLASRVYDLEVFDDGSGPALYATGTFDHVEFVSGFNHIARWDGTSWSQVGSGLGSAPSGDVLAVFDDGSGPALYAAPILASVGLQRWDGASWTVLPDLTGNVASMAVFDQGQGPELYISGSLNQNASVPDSSLVRWNGSSFSAVGQPTPGVRTAMLVWDDGQGPALFTARWGAVDRWDGTTWTTPGGFPGLLGLSTLAVFDDGGGERLYVAGNTPQTVLNLAVYDGATWAQVGGGIEDRVDSLVVFDDGGGPALYAGGNFDQAGGTSGPAMENLARWDGAAYSSVVPDPSSAGPIRASCTFDDGSGPELYAGFDLGNDQHAVLRWDGALWSQVGGTFDERILALHVHDHGAGPELYAGGHFDHVDGLLVNKLARWNGTTWVDAGGGVTGASAAHIGAMTSFDFGLGAGSELVVVGKFGAAGPLSSADNVAGWNGSVWSHPAGGDFNAPIRAVAVYDRGFGPDIYVAGDFTQAGANPVMRIARWNGNTWAPVLGGTSNNILALHVWDDGQGPALFAGGEFLVVNGISTNYLARWNGTAWSAVGTSGNESLVPVYALGVYADEQGPALYAGTLKNTSAPSGLNRWGGTTWSPAPGGNVNGSVLSLTSHDDGSGAGPSLFAFGDFTLAGELGSYRVARSTRSCPCPPETYCTSKVNSQGCTPSIGWAGSMPSVSQSSGFFVTTTSSLAGKSGLFFYGFAPKATPYQGGWLCVQAPAKRTALQDSGGTAPCGGAFSFDFNAHMASGADPGLGAGVDVYGQYWSRDPASSFNTIRTDAIHFLICP